MGANNVAFERTIDSFAVRWMVGLSVVLFGLPALYEPLGEVVAGLEAEDWKRALVAAVIPPSSWPLGCGCC